MLVISVSADFLVRMCHFQGSTKRSITLGIAFRTSVSELLFNKFPSYSLPFQVPAWFLEQHIGDCSQG